MMTENRNEIATTITMTKCLFKSDDDDDDDNKFFNSKYRTNNILLPRHLNWKERERTL